MTQRRPDTRYSTNPKYRAYQLAIQAEYRRRRGVKPRTKLDPETLKQRRAESQRKRRLDPAVREANKAYCKRKREEKKMNLNRDPAPPRATVTGVTSEKKRTSNARRVAKARANAKPVTPPILPPINCAQCGKPFTPTRALAKYCNRACGREYHNTRGTRVVEGETAEIERSAELVARYFRDRTPLSGAPRADTALVITGSGQGLARDSM